MARRSRSEETVGVWTTRTSGSPSVGTWGPGLYSNDTAEDLKPAITAIARLPVSDAELVSLLVDEHRDIAEDAEDEDHTTFWLVLADQLHRKGIDVPTVFERAQTLITSGADDRMMRQLEMAGSDLRKRSRKLAQLAEKLSKPVTAKPRNTLKKPQRQVMEVGEVLCVPVSETGEVRNPYLATEDFAQVGWTILAVLQAERVFGFLAVYRVAVLNREDPLTAQPSLDQAIQLGPWRVESPATCSPSHFKRMGMHSLGRAQLDVHRRIAGREDDIDQMRFSAVHDISIADRLGPRRRGRDTLESLVDIIVR